jgi:hypothetical protein
MVSDLSRHNSPKDECVKRNHTVRRRPSDFDRKWPLTEWHAWPTRGAVMAALQGCFLVPVVSQSAFAIRAFHIHAKRQTAVLCEFVRGWLAFNEECPWRSLLKRAVTAGRERQESRLPQPAMPIKMISSSLETFCVEGGECVNSDLELAMSEMQDRAMTIPSYLKWSAIERNAIPYVPFRNRQHVRYVGHVNGMSFAEDSFPLTNAEMAANNVQPNTRLRVERNKFRRSA